MKKGLTILMMAVLMFTNLIGCSAAPAANTSTTTNVTESASEPKDIQHTIGEGVNINYVVTSEEASIEITGCPSRGDKRSPYVYGTLTSGDPFDYEIMVMVIVGNRTYGPKPFADTPTSMILGDSTFTAQYSSNDGVGTDWNAENILIFLIPSGYDADIQPDVAAGYSVPPSQITKLKENSICVVQIDRAVVES